jgi:Inactive homolog of metal-dependent proteases, putative molecular chaperone
MLTLALDTANDRIAVALAGEGREVARVEILSRGHAERLFPLLDELLTEAGTEIGRVGRIAVNVGPGSFTGIRIAVAAARGLGLALGRSGRRRRRAPPNCRVSHGTGRRTGARRHRRQAR